MMNLNRTIIPSLLLALLGACFVDVDVEPVEEEEATEAAQLCHDCPPPEPYEPPSPPPRPDLTVLSTYSTGTGPNEVATITYRIRNIGTAAGFAGALRLTYRTDSGSYMDHGDYPTGLTIDAGSTRSFTVTVPGDLRHHPLSAFKVTAQIDVWSQTAESVESNNTTTIDF